MGKTLDQFVEAVADASVAEFERLKEFGIKSKNQGKTIAFTFRNMTTVVKNNANEIEGYLQDLGRNQFAGAMERQAAELDGIISNTGDSWDNLLLKFGDAGAGDIMKRTVRGVGASLDSLAENTDVVVDVVQLGLVVALGHAANAATNKIAATAKDIIASRASALTSKSQAEAEIRLATVAKRTAATSIQSTAATNRLTAARSALKVATDRLSIANRSLSLMSGIVGGLPGLLTIAAFWMYSFATSADEASTSSSKFEGHLDVTKEKLQALTKAQLELELFNLDKDGQIEKDIKRLRVLETQLETIRVQRGRPGKASSLDNKSDNTNRNAEIDTIRIKLAKVEKLKALMKEILAEPIDVSNTKPTNPSTQDNGILNSFNQQRIALTERLSLLGKTTELAKAEFAITQGKYKDLLPAQKPVITDLARQIDLKGQSLDADKNANNLAKQLSESSNSYADSLQRKISLSGESSEVARLNFELEHGSLKGITEELKTHLRLMAEKADTAAASDGLDKLRSELATKEELMGEHYGKMHALNAEAWDAKLIGEEEYLTNVSLIQNKYMAELQNLETQRQALIFGSSKQIFTGLAGLAKTFSGEQSKAYKALFAISKGFAVAQGVMNLSTAISNAAALPWPANIPAMAIAASQGAQLVSTIKSSQLQGVAHDGIDNVPREGTWLLDKGERVIDSRTNADLKQALRQDNVGGNVGDTISVTYAPVISAIDSRGVAELMEGQQEAIYNAVAKAKADRGEEF